MVEEAFDFRTKVTSFFTSLNKHEQQSTEDFRLTYASLGKTEEIGDCLFVAYDLGHTPRKHTEQTQWPQ